MSTNITLNEQEVEALGYALDLAYDDQENYSSCANFQLDYGAEWPEARDYKQKQFRALHKLENKLFHGGGVRWSDLADSLEED